MEMVIKASLSLGRNINDTRLEKLLPFSSFKTEQYHQYIFCTNNKSTLNQNPPRQISLLMGEKKSF